MISKEALQAAHAAYDIEEACIREMKEYIDDEQFSRAVELLSDAVRIGTAGCGDKIGIRKNVQRDSDHTCYIL